MVRLAALNLYTLTKNLTAQYGTLNGAYCLKLLWEIMGVPMKSCSHRWECAKAWGGQAAKNPGAFLPQNEKKANFF